MAVNGRLQATLDHTPMAFYMRDLEERWTLLNPETARIFGRSEAELLGRPLRETHPGQAEVWAAHDSSVLASGQPDSFDTVIEDVRTGVPHHFSARTGSRVRRVSRADQPTSEQAAASTAGTPATEEGLNGT